jgi:type IV secretion system protein TrbI
VVRLRLRDRSSSAISSSPGGRSRGGILAFGAGLDDPDPNKQEAKADFLRGEGTLGGGDRVLAKRLEPPPAPFTLTEGTVVPCVLESGINSDLPGVLRARVSRTVYDSATGKVVLIPQGTLLSGEYQSVVAFGQSRLLVKGERLVFPDASSFSLESMPLADEEGYAGFDGDVDNHYIRTFGSAFLLGAISAGVQLGQGSFDDDSSVSDGETPREILAAAVSQQIGQVGAEVTRRNLDVQPTITVAPGKRFNVVVNKDMVFPGPYVEYGAQVETEEGK